MTSGASTGPGFCPSMRCRTGTPSIRHADGRGNARAAGPRVFWWQLRSMIGCYDHRLDARGAESHSEPNRLRPLRPAGRAVPARWTSSAKSGIGTCGQPRQPCLVHAEPRHSQRDLLPARRSRVHPRSRLHRHGWAARTSRRKSAIRTPRRHRSRPAFRRIGFTTPPLTAAIGSRRRS